MRRLRWSSIGVNRIRMIGLAGFFFVTFRVLFVKKKKSFWFVCLINFFNQLRTWLKWLEMMGTIGSRYRFSVKMLWPRFSSVASYVTCTSPIMHPKFCITFVLHFSWELPAVPREIENDAYEKFWDANKVHYGRCASGVSTNFALLKNLREVLAWSC